MARSSPRSASMWAGLPGIWPVELEGGSDLPYCLDLHQHSLSGTVLAQ